MAELAGASPIAITRSPCPLVQWESWADTGAGFDEFASARLGLSLPKDVGRIAGSDRVTAVRIAPRRCWLFAGDRDALPRGLPQELGTELDLSEGRERIDVGTPRLRDVLGQCLAVDWDRTQDRAVLAPMHRIPVLFIRRSTEDGTFVVPRTFAQSIVDWLKDC